MARIVRLTESDMNRLVRKVVNENKMDRIKQSDDFLKLVNILQRHPRATEKLRDELSESLNEDNDEYNHYDYGDSQPKKISKKEYWVRRLKGLGLGAAVGALMGVVMAGGVNADDVLQMALASAAGVGAVSDTIMRTVGRTKEIEPNATNVEENYKRRKTLKEWKGNLSDNENPEKNDFYNKLEEALGIAGENSEYLYMSLSNKIDEWIENHRYENR
jgi:hypothetical protein